MAADRNRVKVGRACGLAVAVGVGAVIAGSAVAPAWATDEGNHEGEQTAASEPSHTSGSEAQTPSRTDEVADDGERRQKPAHTDSYKAAIEDGDDDSENLDGTVTPARTGTPPVYKISSTVTTTAGADDVTAPKAPVAPSALPAVSSLLGSVRRDVENDEDAVPAALPATIGRLLEGGAARASADVATVPAPLSEVESLYTGRPSFIHAVVKIGLNVLKVVLKPFGGLLAFTGLKVPFLTDGVPPFFLTPGLNVERSEFEGMKVWTLTPRKDATDKVVVALHGGAYIATASIFHWWTYADMARDTGATVVVPLQTLVPEGGTAATEVTRTAYFITKMVDDHGAENVSVFGDSAGGGLALAAMQELVRRNARNPSRLVLLAPWLDASMSDPRSAEITDPLLDIPNLAIAGIKWGGSAAASDPLASPLFGSLDGLPPVFVYSSSHDLLTVDSLRLRDRVLAEGISDVSFRFRDGLIHDWFTFPFLPDAHKDRPSVYQDLLCSDVARL